MTGDGVLPGLQQVVIISLFTLDASLVLDLGQLGGALLVHAILQITAHRAISLAHLTKHISLMGLLVKGFLESALLMGRVLPLDVAVDHILVILFEPEGFFLHCLLQQDVLLAVLVHVLQQVDSGLVLTAPLLLTGVPLLLVFVLSKLINVSLISLLVILHVVVMLLQLLDFRAASQSLLHLDLLDGLFTLDSGLEEHLVSIAVQVSGLLSQLLLSGVVRNELQVALSVEHEPLISFSLLFLFFNGPLLLEHGLFSGDELRLLVSLNRSSVLLPIQNRHRVLDLVLFLTGLSHFTLEFFLGVKLPQLSVNLLLHHFLFDVASLVNELLLALDSRAVVVELGVLLS